MGFELVVVPCLQDNFAFLLHDYQSGQTALIDAPEAQPILDALAQRNWSLDLILLTHHHDDHIAGVPALLEQFNAQVMGAKDDIHRLPPLSRALSEGDQIPFGDSYAQVIDVSGHTIGHIAFYFPQLHYCFTGDSLMAAGCGRLFEGSPETMWHSLSKLAALPAETLICSGHDYLDNNLRFARHIDPDNNAISIYEKHINMLRQLKRLPMPIPLSQELAANPFMRASDPAFKLRLNMENSSDSSVFKYIRGLKDQF